MQEVKPYSNLASGKKEQVAGMFNNIAGKYDFLNHFLSMNIDKIWRKKVVKLLIKHKPDRILDVATGTGDLAIASLKAGSKRIDGIDISDGMLAVGIEKIKNKKLDDQIYLKNGDAENIPFEEQTFDAVTVAFGVRNFENLEQGLKEMYRVLKSGGKNIILEFTMPTKFPVKQLYKFYFKYILPTLGKLVSKDDTAYTYLPESVGAFAQRDELIAKMKEVGFVDCYYKSLSFGIAAIYVGSRKVS